jgi:hypothetical protein
VARKSKAKKKAAYFRKRKPEKYNSSESWTVLPGEPKDMDGEPTPTEEKPKENDREEWATWSGSVSTHNKKHLQNS